MPSALEPAAHEAGRAQRARLRHARWVGYRTIVIREYGRILRIWGQTLLPPAVTATLYFIIFGNLIGRRIGAMGGFDYVQYIAPGLIMMSVITNSYGNVVSSFFGAKFGRHLEELLVSPLPNWIILSGYVSGGLVRGLAVGAVVTLVSLVFAHLTVHHLGAILVAVVLTSVTFALGGFINAVFAKNFDQVNFVPTYILTPLTYFGGIFYMALFSISFSIVQLAVPVLAATGGVLLLDEAITPRLVGAGAAILVGIGLALLAKSRPGTTGSPDRPPGPGRT